ncbi:HAMP domain-containing sensor histidine kinase [Pelomonas sp. CA6]|uniref:sensor histidine kinase n=1 Tax=Pelomonas sp. CA6 TaxID=2907999 RepID=UPI0027E04E10|nr:HAMP domain-containing sensor histidine kinase [Pelomonas sp. CA6]
MGERRPGSIALRLGAQILRVSMVWALLAGLCVWLVVRHEADELMDDSLQASAEVLAHLLAEPPAGGWPGPQPPEAIERHFAWQLQRAGRLQARSALAPERAWPLREGFSDWRGEAGTPGWRLYARPLHSGSTEAWLVVAQTRKERREVISGIGLASAGSALLVGGLCTLWLRQRARRELRPLARLAQALQSYDPVQDAQALPEASQQELTEIRSAVVALGERLALRVGNERAFSAHAAHALRTPLAALDAQLAMAMREAPAPLQERLRRSREAADRLRRVVTAMLALFRSGMQLQRRPVALAELLAHLPLPPLSLQLEEPLQLDADPDLLAAALINLIDNAWRHHATRLHLSARTLPDGGRELLLHNDGEALAPERRAALQAALERQQYEGRMGLGLMLADLVARAHGGALWLPPVAQGFAVALWLGPVDILPG